MLTTTPTRSPAAAKKTLALALACGLTLAVAGPGLAAAPVSVALAAPSPAGLGPAAFAAAPAGPRGLGPSATSPAASFARSFRYEVRAMGAHVGQAVLRFGAPELRGAELLRAVTIEARTEGIGARLFKTETTSTSWVDEAWLPVAGRWNAEIPTGKRLVKVVYEGHRVRGQDLRDGKLKHKLDRVLPLRSLDLVSAFGWLCQIDLEAGTKAMLPLYDGIRIYRLDVTVGDLAEVHIPAGARKAVPVHLTVSRGTFRKELTYWLDPVDRTPYKLSFRYGVLGSVDAVLLDARRDA